MSLKEYRRKRNFRVTKEPRGARPRAHSGLTFVIQKHAASHLHYDFRLELDGVLKSWAVPKGPSLDPTTKRLAMHVEDHPLEYGGFEGIIPAGEYGGGTVMLWDRGYWEPIGDPRQGYRNGSLKFVLHGEKLHGHWMLVRKGGKRDSADERHWFLFKEKDQFAETNGAVTEKEPLSVTTGRDLDEIADQANRVWGRHGEIKNLKRRSAGSEHNGARRPSKRKTAKLPDQRTVEAAIRRSAGKQSALFKTAEVELATLTDQPPDGNDWLHEIKFDGYRMLCRIDGQAVRFISRNGKDWTARFPTLVEAAEQLPIKTGVLDGEIVIVQPDGTTSFQALQNAFQDGKEVAFTYFAFDLLYANGRDIRTAAIEDRKQLLQLLVPQRGSGPIRFSEHVVGKGPQFFAEAGRLKLEGIVSKRVGRPYLGGRGADWLKIKCSLREEFVIGGFTKPGGSRSNFGALLLGYFDEDKQFIYAGRVGTGFGQQTLGSLHATLNRIVQKHSPYVNLSGTTGQARGVTWVKPQLVAQIQFSNWTDEQQLRHPVFLGLREDKRANEVVRDRPIPVEVARSNQSAPHPGRKGKKRLAKTSHANDAEIAGIRLSHPDKVLYPDDNITKLDLAHYYEQISEWMLPYVSNRLLSLVRCPAGSGSKCFFQKHPGEGTPNELRHFRVVEKRKTEEHLALYDLPGLIALVQMGVLEIHVWGSTADHFEKPDRLIFDLDPDPAVEWPTVIAAAKEVRLLLQELELESFVKTTGGKGLHVVVPIQRRSTWPQAKEFCQAVADFLTAAAPTRYVAVMSKAARKGKIFVDYLRNDRGATAIAPYSTRSRPGATVSVPLAWNELKTSLTSDHFTIRNLPARLARRRSDPWKEMAKIKQSITLAMVEKLNRLAGARS